MDPFEGKSVAIVGISVEGADSARFFLKHKSSVVCCDRRTPAQLGHLYDELSSLGAEFHSGDGYLDGLDGFDYVLRTPGLSPRTPQLAALVAAGKPATSSTKLFFDLCRAPIIGVTGTKGKGTTSTLIAQILERSGKRVFLGGNVGVPLLSRVEEIGSDDVVVFELSSFQLEDLHKSPHVAVVLRITEDHLANFDKNSTNFHPTREAYVQAKSPIVRHQNNRDFIIYNLSDPTSSSFTGLTPAVRHSFSRYDNTADAFVQDHAVFLRQSGGIEKICTSDEIRLRGDHNLENIAAATMAAVSMGVGLDDIRGSVRDFAGLPHRLQQVGIAGGVTYVDDSFSTVPETTVAAIESFTAPIILIAGGSEKGADFTDMGKAIAKSSVKVLIAIGQMTDRIVKAARDAGFAGEVITGLPDMPAIIARASGIAGPGDVVLLSPAAASFGMFNNYKERGEKFAYEVSRLA